MSAKNFTSFIQQIKEELLSLDKKELNKKIDEVASGDTYDLLKYSGFFSEREKEFQEAFSDFSTESNLLADVQSFSESNDLSKWTTGLVVGQVVFDTKDLLKQVRDNMQIISVSQIEISQVGIPRNVVLQSLASTFGFAVKVDSSQSFVNKCSINSVESESVYVSETQTGVPWAKAA
jgi:hypothetical protein